MNLELLDVGSSGHAELGYRWRDGLRETVEVRPRLPDVDRAPTPGPDRTMGDRPLGSSPGLAVDLVERAAVAPGIVTVIPTAILTSPCWVRTARS